MLLGGAVASGILSPLTWPAAVTGLLVLFVVRPVTAWVGLSGTTTPKRRARRHRLLRHPRDRLAVLPGVRRWSTPSFPDAEQLWALVAFTVVVSILVHGTSATLVTRRLDARREDEQSTAKMEA